MPRLSSSKWKLPDNCDLNRYDIWKHEIDHKSTFCNLKTTYPAYLPSIFSSFGLGALELENPAFQLFFYCPPIYIYTYFIQGSN